ncbi:MAG: diadenylate cyclase CdaA [Lachnospiraceae bacterium]|nr:diadenylate cyclase CdaA [Lachnospiraceae bacterium]
MSRIIAQLFSGVRIPVFTPIDALEILILAFLVYELLVWIQTTRAWTLMKGIVTIGICVLLAYLLEMDTLIYIVNRGLGIVLMMIIVVFQPEIRRVLEQLGERQLISRLLPSQVSGSTVAELFSDHTVMELVKAATEMSKARTGALIVIMQNERMDEYERTGIAIDAAVSSQLLINIFEHNTPLHDGAVIMEGNRIVAATCYLPLTNNLSLSKELGTRHRAGVGISEVTDSFTIIVSEETGAISTAYKGVLERGVSPDLLRRKLTILQNKTVQTRRFLLWKGKAKHEAKKD